MKTPDVEVSFDSDGCPIAGSYAERDLVRGPFEGHVVGNVSHLLRPDPDSVGPRGYRRAVRAPVSPEVLGLITAWVQSYWDARTEAAGQTP
jgi:hypothetical protein